MKTPTLLILLALVLSGCSDADAGGASENTTAAPETTDAPSATAGPNTTAPTPLEIAIDPVPGDAPASLDVTGTVTPGAVVTVRVMDDDAVSGQEAIVANGTWRATIDVPIGQSVLEVVADDGMATARAQTDLLRRAEMTFQVTYKGSLQDDREDVVLADPDAFTSAPDYDGCEVGHPGHFTVHDAMVQWSHATDVAITYGDCGQFGYSVTAIDGHESPGFWCYSIDGEAAETGISSQAVAVGQVVAWDDCTIVLG